MSFVTYLSGIRNSALLCAGTHVAEWEDALSICLTKHMKGKPVQRQCRSFVWLPGFRVWVEQDPPEPLGSAGALSDHLQAFWSLVGANSSAIHNLSCKAAHWLARGAVARGCCTNSPLYPGQRLFFRDADTADEYKNFSIARLSMFQEFKSNSCHIRHRVDFHVIVG